MPLHRWDISPKQAIELQKRLAGKLRVEPLPSTVATVAGADCAFLDGGKRIVAVAVLCDGRTMELLESAWVVRACRFPYVPGLLSFREAPAVIAAVKKLRRPVDLLLCDGQGMAHPRRIGLASHVGLWLDLPTVGVAKSRLCGAYHTPGERRGCRRPLKLNGHIIGSVVRTRHGVKPVFISVGHRITLPEAVAWTLRCGRGVRLPEPTRRAHQQVTRRKAQLCH